MGKSHVQDKWTYKGLSASMAVALAFGMVPASSAVALASEDLGIEVPESSDVLVEGAKTVDPSIEQSNTEAGVFKTLQEAVASSEDGGSIVLKGDVAESLSIEKNVTIDGQGKYVISGKTTLKNGTLKDLTLTSDEGAILVLGNAAAETKAVLSGVTVKYRVSGVSGNDVNVVAGNNASIEVNNCLFANDAQNNGVTVQAPQWSYGIYVNDQGEKGSVSFSGTAFNGAFRTMIANANGAFTVSGCTFSNSIFSNNSGSTSGSGEEATCFTTANKPVDRVRIENSVFDNAGALYFQKTAGAVVSGNTFKFDKFAHFVQAKGSDSSALDLSGNSFVMGENKLVVVDVKASPIVLPAGVKAVSFWAWSDTASDLKPADYSSYVYSYDANGKRTFYPESFAALKAFIVPAEGNIGVEEGETVHLQSDIKDARGMSVPSGKSFTLDFGGHEYVLVGPGAGSAGTETSAFQLLKDSNLTFKNGTVKVNPGAENVKRLVQSYANVTFENMRFESANQVGGEDYALSFNNGEVHFKGSSSIVSNSNKTVAFDVCYWADSYPDGVKVTFDDDYAGTVTGRIVYDSTDASKATLAIGGHGRFVSVDVSKESTKNPAISISGGTFQSKPASSLLSEGFVSAAFYSDILGEEEQDGLLIGHVVGNAAAFDLSAVSVPEKPGRVFAGWVNSADGKTYRPDENPAVSEGTQFVPKWASQGGGTGGGGNVEPPAKGETVVNPDGSTTTTVVGNDGSKTETTVSEDKGVTTVVEKDKDGAVTSASATVTEEAVESAAGKAVELPMAPVEAVSSDKAVEVKVEAPAGAKVAVPVAKAEGSESVAPGAVLVLVDAEGNETVLPKTANDGSSLSAQIPGDCTLKVVDASASFPDVASDDWYEEQGVADFISARGVMAGVETESGAEFRGDAPTNRGMFVTMLNRLEMEAKAESGEGFADVDPGSWYEASSAWAVEAGIATGYLDAEGNATFDGEGKVTREQMATFLFRYAQWLGLDTDARAEGEIEGVSDFAKDAVSWAVAEGLIKGDDTTGAIRPTDGATRAEAAAVVMRMVGLLA